MRSECGNSLRKATVAGRRRVDEAGYLVSISAVSRT